METSPQAATESRIGLVGRMLRTFYAPGELYEDVARKHSWHDWFLPTLLTAVVMTVAAQITMPLTLEMQREAMKKSLAQQELTAEQRENQEAMMEKMQGVTEASTLIITPISIFVLMFITSGIILLAGRYALGGEISYGQVLAMQGYASLILILQVLVLTPIRLEKGTALLFLGPSLFFDKGELTGLVGGMIGIIDIFSIWQSVVVAIGLSALTRASLGKSLTVMGILYLIYIAIFGGLSGLSGA